MQAGNYWLLTLLESTKPPDASVEADIRAYVILTNGQLRRAGRTDCAIFDRMTSGDIHGAQDVAYFCNMTRAVRDDPRL